MQAFLEVLHAAERILRPNPDDYLARDAALYKLLDLLLSTVVI